MSLNMIFLFLPLMSPAHAGTSKLPDYSKGISYHHKYVAPNLKEIFIPGGPLQWLERNMAIQLGEEKATAMIAEIEDRNLYQEITITEMVAMAFNFDFQRDMNATMHSLKKKDPANKMIEDACKTLIQYAYLEKSRY